MIDSTGEKFENSDLIKNKIGKISIELQQMHEEFAKYLLKLKTFGELNIAVHQVDTKACRQKSQLLVGSLVQTMEGLLLYLKCTIAQICKQLATIEMEMCQSLKQEHSCQIYEIPVQLENSHHSLKQKQGLISRYFEELCLTKSLDQLFTQGALTSLLEKLNNQGYFQSFSFNTPSVCRDLYEIPLEFEVQKKVYEREIQLYEYPTDMDLKAFSVDENQKSQFLSLQLCSSVYQITHNPSFQLNIKQKKSKNKSKRKLNSNNDRQGYEQQEGDKQFQLVFEEDGSEFEQLPNFNKIYEVPVEIFLEGENEKEEIAYHNIYQLACEINDFKTLQISQPQFNVIVENTKNILENEKHLILTPKAENIDSEEEEDVMNMREKYTSSLFMEQNENPFGSSISENGSKSITPHKEVTPAQFYQLLQEKNSIEETNLRLSSRIAEIQLMLEEGQTKFKIMHEKYEQEKYEKVEILKRISEQIDKYEEKLEEMAIFNQEKVDENKELRFKLIEGYDFVKELEQKIAEKTKEVQEKQLRIHQIQLKFSEQVISHEKEVHQKNELIQILQTESLQSFENMKSQHKMVQDLNQELRDKLDLLQLENAEKADQLQAIKIQYKELADKLSQMEEVAYHTRVYKDLRTSRNSMRRSQNMSRHSRGSRANRKRDRMEEQNIRLHKELIDRLEDLDDAKSLISEQEHIIESFQREIVTYKQKTKNKDIEYSRGIEQENEYLRNEIAQLEQKLEEKQIIIEFMEQNFERQLQTQLNYELERRQKKVRYIEQNYVEVSNKKKTVNKASKIMDIKEEQFKFNWLTSPINTDGEYVEKLETLLMHYESIIGNNLLAIEQLQNDMVSFMEDGIQKQALNESLLEENQILEEEIQINMRQRMAVEREKEKLEKLIFSDSGSMSIENQKHLFSKKTSDFQESFQFPRKQSRNNRQELGESYKFERTDDESLSNGWSKAQDFVPVRTRSRRNCTFYKKVII